jgi:predicted Na+-dependent transporter
MAKKKSFGPKRSRRDTENGSLTQEDHVKVKSLAKDILVIVAFFSILCLFIKKVSTVFDDGIQWTGWLILGVCLTLITGLVIWVYPWVERVTGMNENKAINCTVIVLVGIMSAAVYLLWEYIVPFFVSNVK